jgi:hypothetical protein
MDSWTEAVRYCKFAPEGRGLAKKAKKGHRLSQAEVAMVYRLAEDMKWVVGFEGVELPQELVDLPLDLSADKTLFKAPARFIHRAGWVIEEYTGDVVGKYEKNRAVRFYPNAHVLVADLKSVFSGE